MIKCFLSHFCELVSWKLESSTQSAFVWRITFFLSLYI